MLIPFGDHETTARSGFGNCDARRGTPARALGWRGVRSPMRVASRTREPATVLRASLFAPASLASERDVLASWGPVRAVVVTTRSSVRALRARGRPSRVASGSRRESRAGCGRRSAVVARWRVRGKPGGLGRAVAWRARRARRLRRAPRLAYGDPGATRPPGGIVLRPAPVAPRRASALRMPRFTEGVRSERQRRPGFGGHSPRQLASRRCARQRAASRSRRRARRVTSTCRSSRRV